jgi:hypothetical protein
VSLHALFEGLVDVDSDRRHTEYCVSTESYVYRSVSRLGVCGADVGSPHSPTAPRRLRSRGVREPVALAGSRSLGRFAPCSHSLRSRELRSRDSRYAPRPPACGAYVVAGHLRCPAGSSDLRSADRPQHGAAVLVSRRIRDSPTIGNLRFPRCGRDAKRLVNAVRRGPAEPRSVPPGSVVGRATARVLVRWVRRGRVGPGVRGIDRWVPGVRVDSAPTRAFFGTTRRAGATRVTGERRRTHGHRVSSGTLAGCRFQKRGCIDVARRSRPISPEARCAGRLGGFGSTTSVADCVSFDLRRVGDRDASVETRRTAETWTVLRRASAATPTARRASGQYRGPVTSPSLVGTLGEFVHTAPDVGDDSVFLETL